MQNDSIVFRKAGHSDTDRIMEIMQQAKDQMKRLGSCQWNENYPARENIITDIGNDEGYVFEKEGTVIAYGVISFTEEDVYRQINTWTTDDKYLVVHRLAVADEAKHQGLGKRFMLKAEDVARQRGVNFFRVDTKYDNNYMLSIFKSLGFVYKGDVVYRGGEERLAFEKDLRYTQMQKSDISDNIVIYQAEDGEIKLDVKVEGESVWLTQAQMSELFGRDRTVIGKHIKNIFSEGELSEKVVCAKIAHTTSHGAIKGKSQTKEIVYYNLDVIISVGYRVKSKRGTQFRIWANKILKEYIIKGYAINQKLKLERYEELKDVVRILGNTLRNQENLTSDQSKGLLAVVTDYVYALDTLDKYDYQQLSIEQTTNGDKFRATYENAMEAIMSLKGKFGESELFAHEKDQSFKSSIATIYQTFDGIELYPSIEEKAAMLLYLVTKNHSFSDGNKRIAAMLFLWFMENNGILYRNNGEKRIADNTLVAITLMIAESRTEEKDIMVKVVVNLINKNN